MKNNEFNKIIKKYISSKSRSENKDLKNDNGDEQKKFAPRANKTTIFSIISCFAIVVIALAIALPLTLTNKDKNNEGEMGFGSMGEFRSAGVDSYEQLTDKFGIKPNIILPVEKYNGAICVTTLTEDNSAVGGSAGFGVYDEYFNDVDMHFYIKGVYSSVVSDWCTEKVVWQGRQVNYRTLTEDIDNGFLTQYDTDIYIVDETYEYYIKIQYFKEFEITELMDMFFIAV